MTDSHIVSLRNGMENTIREHFPTSIVPMVKTHIGEFGVNEIKHYSISAPAIILTIGGSKSERRGGSVYCDLNVAAFILTKGRTDAERESIGLLVFERLLKLLHDTHWNNDVETVQTPRDVKGRNLYSGPLDQMGLFLWAVTWQQLIEIPYVEDYDSLDDFARLYNNIIQPGQVLATPPAPDTPATLPQMIELETTP